MQRLLERLTSRFWILLDATFCGIAALLLLTVAGQLNDLFHLPVTLLRVVGIVLIPYVSLLIVIAIRSSIARTAAWSVIGTNTLWTAASFILLVSGQVAPNALGIAFVIVQAIIVALFAAFQFLALGKSRTAGTMPVACT